MGDSFSRHERAAVRGACDRHRGHQADGRDQERQVHLHARPGEKQARFDLTDREFGAGESWYYARVLQEDGQMAWSSPMWVKKQ